MTHAQKPFDSAQGRLELPQQARKIIEQESRAIADLLQECRKRAQAPADAIDALCTLLNLRGRYSSITAEHFDRQDYEGVQIIDALDEALAMTARALLKGFVDRHKRTPDLKALRLVAEKLSAALKELPPYPVAYMVLGAMHAAMNVFQKLVDAGTGHELPALEHSLVHYLLGLVDKYVQTRERPLERHHSDIQREYVVVRRMKCPCGQEQYDVTMQALCHTPEGTPFDRLDLQCKACGARRSITFDLPFFKDLEKM